MVYKCIHSPQIRKRVWRDEPSDSASSKFYQSSSYAIFRLVLDLPIDRFVGAKAEHLASVGIYDGGRNSNPDVTPIMTTLTYQSQWIRDQDANDTNSTSPLYAVLPWKLKLRTLITHGQWITHALVDADLTWKQRLLITTAAAEGRVRFRKLWNLVFPFQSFSYHLHRTSFHDTVLWINGYDGGFDKASKHTIWLFIIRVKTVVNYHMESVVSVLESLVGTQIGINDCA